MVRRSAITPSFPVALACRIQVVIFVQRMRDSATVSLEDRCARGDQLQCLPLRYICISAEPVGRPFCKGWGEWLWRGTFSSRTVSTRYSSRFGSGESGGCAVSIGGAGCMRSHRSFSMSMFALLVLKVSESRYRDVEGRGGIIQISGPSQSSPHYSDS